jgi:YVTN family beta-propeller protein
MLSNDVTVLNASTLKQVTTVPMRSSGAIGMAFDNSTGEVYVPNAGNDTITVINGSTNSVASRIRVGAHPSQMAFDRADRYGYVTLENGSLGVFNATTGAMVAWIPISPIPEGVAYDDWNRCLYLGSGSPFLTVVAERLQTFVTVSNETAEAGSAATFTAHVEAGIPSFSYTWTFGDGARESGTSNTTTHVYATPGHYAVKVTVTDLANLSASAETFVLVDAGPDAATPRASAPSAFVGQTVTYTTSASLGTAPYIAYAWGGLPSGCRDEEAAAVTCLLTTAGNLSITVVVTDSWGVTSPPSPALAFPVYPDPVLRIPVANRSSGDVGQTVGFFDAASLGWGNYTFVWSGLPAGCPGTRNPTICSLSEAGSYLINVAVADADNVMSGQSPPLAFRVYADPSVSLSANRTSLDQGQSLSFSTTSTPGSGPDIYTWSGLPPGCAGTGATISCSPSGAATKER